MPDKAQFNPSTLKVLFNPNTQKAFYTKCLHANKYTLTVSGILECPEDSWPSNPNGVYDNFVFQEYSNEVCKYYDIASNPNWRLVMWYYTLPPNAGKYLCSLYDPITGPLSYYRAFLKNIAASPLDNSYALEDCGTQYGQIVGYNGIITVGIS